MTPEEKALLERTANLAVENNAILRSLLRSNRIGIAMRIVYWVVIIVLAFGATYFIQPYFTTLMGITGQVGGIQGLQNSLNQAQDSANQLRDLLK